MDVKNKNQIDKALIRLTNILILNSSFINNIGLINGKMGIAIFFYHYSKYTNNKDYAILADELIDEIYEDVNENTNTDFENGLMGIGWGIEYLHKRNFLIANTDEILEDLDQVIYKKMINCHSIFNDTSDFFGYGLYCVERLKGKNKEVCNIKLLDNQINLIYLIDECERILIQKRLININIDNDNLSLLNSITNFLLDVKKLNIYNQKVKKLLSYLSIYLNSSKYTNNIIEENFKNNILNKIDKSVKSKYLFQNFEFSILDIIKNGLYYIIYCNNYNLIKKDNKNIRKVMLSINDEFFWKQQLMSLNDNNLGLNGLAGIGLGLIL